MIKIKTMDEWKQLLKSSTDKPVVLLKHSRICSISDVSFRVMKEAEDKNKLSQPVYLLVIQDAREVSTAIAVDLSVKHESPQVIVIRDGKAVFDASHHVINPGEIEPYLQ